MPTLLRKRRVALRVAVNDDLTTAHHMKRPTRAFALRQSRVAARSSAPVGPRFIEPCHPAERDRAPTGSTWLHEIKADGYRAQLHLRAGKATVYSRRGHDWTEQFSTIAHAAQKLRVKSAVLDGEVIVQDAAGRADYHAAERAGPQEL